MLTKNTQNAVELIEYKATKAHWRPYRRNQTFQLNEIQLQKGDTIYLASDGFATNLAQPKKLMTKDLKKIAKQQIYQCPATKKLH